MTLTQKETTLLSDLKFQEQLCIEKYNTPSVFAALQSSGTARTRLASALPRISPAPSTAPSPPPPTNPPIKNGYEIFLVPIFHVCEANISSSQGEHFKLTK